VIADKLNNRLLVVDPLATTLVTSTIQTAWISSQPYALLETHPVTANVRGSMPSLTS
jgi:hypothetical protein